MKKVNNKVYVNNSNLSPYWVSGFSDAEASFSIRITKDKNRKTGWRVLPIFIIELHSKDIVLLRRLRAFFDVGILTERKNNRIVYYVQAFTDLTKVIIPHFNKYPLLTQKNADFILFKDVVDLLNSKEQASMEGLQKIINIRASMNKGLSEDLKNVFSSTSPVIRPIIKFVNIPDPNWFVGFVDGEGCFYVRIIEDKLRSITRVSLKFSLSQHSRDDLLMSKMIYYLNCGIIEKPKGRFEVRFVVYKFEDIKTKIISFLIIILYKELRVLILKILIK